MKAISPILLNIGQIHFVLINTDTLTDKADPKTGLIYAGWIPINWIEEDIKKAQDDPSISHIIVMGHKFIENSHYMEYRGEPIVNTEEYPLRDRLIEIMEENSKVRCYVACHAHLSDTFRLKEGNSVWQIISGNGGAPLIKSWQPEGGPYYGYAFIDVYESGKIIVKDYGRPLPPPPQKFYEDSPVAPEPATLRKTTVIYTPE